MFGDNCMSPKMLLIPSMSQLNYYPSVFIFQRHRPHWGRGYYGTHMEAHNGCVVMPTTMLTSDMTMNDRTGNALTFIKVVITLTAWFCMVPHVFCGIMQNHAVIIPHMWGIITRIYVKIYVSFTPRLSHPDSRDLRTNVHNTPGPELLVILVSACCIVDEDR